MGTDSIRSAFVAAARGRLTVKDVQLGYAEQGGQVLHFTGWHQDGTPFAFVSATFIGTPEHRAAQIAEDLAVAVTATEGGPWIPFEDWQRSKWRDACVHSIMFDDDTVWDAVSGWRKSCRCSRCGSFFSTGSEC